MELPVQLSKFKLPMSWGIILVLLMLLFLQRECQRCPKCPEEKVITKTVVIPGDKVPVFIPTKAPKPVYIDTGSYHIEYKEGKASKIDTLAIMKDYLSKYYYNDTIKDTSFVAIIKEVLYKNRIIDRQLYVQNLRQKIVNTTTVLPMPKLRNKIFIGAGLSSNLSLTNSKPGVMGSVLLVTKKDHGYEYSYDVINKIHSVGMYWKL